MYDHHYIKTKSMHDYLNKTNSISNIMCSQDKLPWVYKALQNLSLFMRYPIHFISKILLLPKEYPAQKKNHKCVRNRLIKYSTINMHLTLHFITHYTYNKTPSFFIKMENPSNFPKMLKLGQKPSKEKMR